MPRSQWYEKEFSCGNVTGAGFGILLAKMYFSACCFHARTLLSFLRDRLHSRKPLPIVSFETFCGRPPQKFFFLCACRMIITVTQDDSRLYEGSYIHIYLERSCNNLSCHENNIIRSQFNVFPSSLSILNIIQNVSMDHMLRLSEYTYMYIPTI